LAQVLIELASRHASLYRAIEIARSHRKYAVHAGQIECYAAGWCVDVAFERSARAKGDHGHAMLSGQLNDADDFFSGHRPDDNVWRFICDPGQRVRVLLAGGFTCRYAITKAVPQQRHCGLTLSLGIGLHHLYCHYRPQQSRLSK
jgi:hypothetical protein